MDRETRRALILEAAVSSRSTFENRIEWASHALEVGADSESLRVLASLSLEERPDPHEVDKYFRRSLEDLAWWPLRCEMLLRQHARDLCEGFLSGRLSPERLTHEMHQMAVDLDYPGDLSYWIGLDDGWSLIGFWHPTRGALVDAIRQEARALVEATPKKFV